MSYRVRKAKGTGPIDTNEILHSLFCQHSTPICRYLTRLTGDTARAEELTQETFLRAYNALEKGARWQNPRAWLYRVASRLAINEHRRRRLLQWLPLKSTDADPGVQIEHHVAERLAVQAALEQLAPKYRVPLVLYLEEGYSVSEIAGILDLSESAVKVRLFRARQQFKSAYQDQDRGQETVSSLQEARACVRAQGERS